METSMEITDRIGNTMVFHHGPHVYTCNIQDCTQPQGTGLPDTGLLTPEMLCVRPNCAACEAVAIERGIPGYRVPAQTYFPVTGDSQAMEMHARRQVVDWLVSHPDFTREELRDALIARFGNLDPEHREWAIQRLRTALINILGEET